MKAPLAIVRSAVLVLLLAPAQAQDQPGNNNDGFSPELEAAFREFSKEAADSRRDQATKALEELAAELAREVKLDPAARAKLAEHYPQIVEATQAAWQDRFQQWLRTSLKRAPDPADTLERWDAESLARNPSEVWSRPDQTEAWQDALEQVLNEPQLARYQANQRDRTEKARQQIQDFLEAGQQWVRDSLSPTLEAELTQFQRHAALQEEQANRLKAAADATIEDIAGNWRQRAEKLMLEMDDATREQRLRNRHFLRLDSSAPGNQPKEHHRWREALAEVLTEEQRQNIETRRKEIRARRAQALAMILVEATDRFLGLTGGQRPRLQAVLQPSLLTLPDHYFVPPRPDAYLTVNPQQLFPKVSELEKDKLRSVLDAGQRQQWHEMQPGDLARHSHYSTRAKDLEWLESPPENEGDLFADQRLISRFLHHRSQQVRQRDERVMAARAAAVARIAELSPAQAAELQTAAKGAARLLSASQINSLESWIRRSAQSAKPGQLARRLKRMGMPYFGRNHLQQDPELWTTTVKRVLTPAQRQAWENELEAAAAWRRKTQVTLVLSETERHLALTPEKRDLLRDLVGNCLEQYCPDLDRNLTYQWHWHGYYCMIPFALLSDEELAPALDPEQITIVRSRNPGHFAELIKNIRKNHEQRLEKEKP